MFYIVPTKRGMGVELWGTAEDLQNIYSVIGNFWNKEEYLNKPGFESRDKLVSGFSYELRKSFSGYRLKRKNSHFSTESLQYFGCKISWVHFLFTLSALRYNMRFFESNKLHISIFLQLEFWLDQAMDNYDKAGARKLRPFISNSIYAENEMIYLFMRKINAEYFKLGGGKKAFRRLPDLLQMAIYYTEGYERYHLQLKKDAELLKCQISDLEINDDHIDYENLQW